MSEKVVGVDGADLILKGEEKDAYLEFIEAGGAAEMKARLYGDIEHREWVIRRKKADLEEYKNVRDAISRIDSPGYDKETGRWITSISDICGFRVDFGRIGKNGFSKEQYMKIFETIHKYMIERIEINDFESELIKKYDKKILNYKNKVRKSFIRRLLKFIKG